SPAGYREPAQRQLHQLHGVLALPLRHEGTLLAVLIVGPAGETVSEIEALHQLTTFSQMAGIALHAVQSHETLEGLHRELQAKVDKIAEMQKRIVTLQSQLSRQNPRESRAEDEADPAAAAAVDAAASVEGIVSASDGMRQLLATVRKVAASPSAALIRGESGTGKEVVARALHEWSPRAKGPFVKVHCAALSPGLLESELFGHVKGAFTGAHRDKAGRFELADKGTLFLDEIGDISLDVQTKLLRVLQEMTFERVGSSESITVDVRVVAATNQDLEKLMREGRFREDLFFRLNVIMLRTPPLRDRREDILELALHFLRLFTQRSGRSSLLHYDDDAIMLL
ncbi:MAG TPA: sigma 54-interacting transcriptional regulator, partial [Gemmatales bacterium]|nr:sigma 54-interacting transcriptional regulator [Gemmatales bacterium]